MANELNTVEQYITQLNSDLKLMNEIKELIWKANECTEIINIPIKKEYDSKPEYNPPKRMSPLSFNFICNSSVKIYGWILIIVFFIYDEVIDIILPRFILSFFYKHPFIGVIVLSAIISFIIALLMDIIFSFQAGSSAKKQYDYKYKDFFKMIEDSNKRAKEYNKDSNKRKAARKEAEIELLSINEMLEEKKKRLERQYTLKNVYAADYNNIGITHQVLYLFTSSRAETLKEAINISEEQLRHREHIDAMMDMQLAQKRLSKDIERTNEAVQESTRKSMEAAQAARSAYDAAEDARIAAEYAEREARFARYN